jgi:hypothetical protein
MFRDPMRTIGISWNDHERGEVTRFTMPRAMAEQLLSVSIHESECSRKLEVE